MSDSTILHGIILSAVPIGEYDRRVLILTRERGKISAFAKGAQRPKSALISAAQPFVTGAFHLIEGRSAYTMIRADVDNYFSEYRADAEKTFLGIYFCEITEYMTEEDNDERATLVLLYRALQALGHSGIGLALARVVFELKMLWIGGIGPQVSACVRCGDREGPFVLHVPSGGCLCRRCAGNFFDEAGRKEMEVRTQIVATGYRNLEDSTWFALRFIAATPPKDLYSFAVSDTVLAELRAVSEDWYREYVGHEFRSAEMVTAMEGVSE